RRAGLGRTRPLVAPFHRAESPRRKLPPARETQGGSNPRDRRTERRRGLNQNHHLLDPLSTGWVNSQWHKMGQFQVSVDTDDTPATYRRRCERLRELARSEVSRIRTLQRKHLAPETQEQIWDEWPCGTGPTRIWNRPLT